MEFNQDYPDPVEAAKTGTPLPSNMTRTPDSLPMPPGFETKKSAPTPSASLDKYGNSTALTREFEQRLKGLQDFNQKFETPATAQSSTLPQPTMPAMPNFASTKKPSSPFTQHDAWLKKSIWDGSPQSNPFLSGTQTGYNPSIQPYNAMPGYNPSIAEYNWFNR